MNNQYLPALLNAQSKLRSTVKFSLLFSFSSFKPCNQENTMQEVYVDSKRQTELQID